jgi:membrane protease subunit HflK
MAAALVVLAVSWWASSSQVTIAPGEAGVVRRFGVIVPQPIQPGLHLRFPWPVERVDVVDRDTARLVEFGFRLEGTRRVRDGGVAQELDLVTGDENLVDVTAVLQYRVVDPVAYLVGCEVVDEVIRQVGAAAVSDVLVHQRIDEVLTTHRPQIQDQVLSRSQHLVDDYGLGVMLDGFRLLDVHAPAPVHDAFRDVASAQEDQATSINRAEGYRDATLAQARGEAVAVGTRATAHAEGATLRATAESTGFVLLLDAAATTRTLTRRRLYLEALEQVLDDRRIVVRPGRSGGEFELWLFEGDAARPADGSGGRSIQVPVLPQAPGDPRSATVTLEEP